MSLKNKNQETPILGITLGDINGIGPEVVLKALSDHRILSMFTPVVYGSAKIISFYKKNLSLEDLNYTQVRKDGEYVAKRINVVNCLEESVEVKFGEANEESGKSAYLALKKATEDLKAGHIHGLVTAPINKHTIQNEAFQFAGHTEFLAAEFGAKDHLMLLTSDQLRVGVVTGHIPIKEVAAAITAEKLQSKIDILEKSLKVDFGINKPRIAILGLNPHAGEGGLLGEEEEKIIKPLIAEQKNKGKLVFGPYPADGFFGKGEHRKFDGILAMYHDQGLIPFKTLAFETGVNFTAGLSIVRTSPDHGTAYGIAGKFEASESSMRQALYLACDICKNRQESSTP
jgi:4-phospho-D-threonate 3-dehydrogenase / 4-phospho-D-erythronate 3-dehydrogenase